MGIVQLFKKHMIKNQGANAILDSVVDAAADKVSAHLTEAKIRYDVMDAMYSKEAADGAYHEYLEYMRDGVNNNGEYLDDNGNFKFNVAALFDKLAYILADEYLQSNNIEPIVEKNRLVTKEPNVLIRLLKTFFKPKSPMSLIKIAGRSIIKREVLKYFQKIIRISLIREIRGQEVVDRAILYEKSLEIPPENVKYLFISPSDSIDEIEVQRFITSLYEEF